MEDTGKIIDIILYVRVFTGEVDCCYCTCMYFIYYNLEQRKIKFSEERVKLCYLINDVKVLIMIYYFAALSPVCGI